MVNVLFVCLGNICRSPMAEAMFRNLVKKEGLENQIHIDSAGTGDWHIGHIPHEGTRELLDRKGVSYEGMSARQIGEEDFNRFDYIIGMDESNIENMKKVQRGKTDAYIGRLLDLVSDEMVKDVPDPYYTGNFDEVHDLVKKGCEALLEKIRTEKQI